MFRYEPGTEEHPNIQVIIAHIHSAWNYQKRFTVNGPEAVSQLTNGCAAHD
jgi:hypothetical protein